MRFLILGAGAIGGTIGGRLFEHDHEVVFVARGSHLNALHTRGLELRDPDKTVQLAIKAVGTVAEAQPRAGDVAILASKTQHSEALLSALAGCAPPGVAVVCAQNGVENERLALRRFSNTYGMRVMVAGTHLEPGVVEIATAPVWGILDLGRYPEGSDEFSEHVAQVLHASGFDARASAQVMSLKYLKLLSNLGNAIEAAVGTREDSVARDLGRAAQSEALACFAVAGIQVAEETDEGERRRQRGFIQPVGGSDRAGGSSWQSLQRRTGNIEADWLNGEVVLLGRLHGIPTPVNERLQEVANRLSRQQMSPGSMTSEELAGGLL
jgi:2-dehydropantoate 2-reductase